MIIEQTQKTGKTFRLPLSIDVYNGAIKNRFHVWVESMNYTFSFNYTRRPDLINVDADKVMLWAKTDNKTAENYVFQYNNAPLYLDRKEALDYFAKKGMKELSLGLKDKFAPLRKSTLDKLAASKMSSDPEVLNAAEKIANTDKDRKTKASALDLLAKTADAKYLPIYKKYVDDSSYTVAGSALQALAALDPASAYPLAKKYSADAKGDLGQVVTDIIMSNGTESDFDMIADRYNKAPLSQEKLTMTEVFCAYLEKVNNLANVKKGIDAVMKFRNAIPEQFRNFTEPTFKAALSKLSKAKGGEIADYITNSMK